MYRPAGPALCCASLALCSRFQIDFGKFLYITGLFYWKKTGTAFVNGTGLGPEYNGTSAPILDWPTWSRTTFSEPPNSTEPRVKTLQIVNIFQTNPGDTAVSGYTPHFLDIASLLNAHLNQPLRLRFAEVDNLFTLQAGVDNVQLLETAGVVPEPSYWLVILGALLTIFWIRRRTIAQE